MDCDRWHALRARWWIIPSVLYWLLGSAANATTRTLAEIDPIVISGQAAPGTNSTFASVATFVTNRFGKVAFRGTLHSTGGVDPSNNVGLWTDAEGAVTLVARTSELAPGAPEGTNFIEFSSWEINSPGTIVFHAHWTGSGNDRNEGIWKTAAGGLQLVARTDVPAPGVTPAAETGAVFFPSLNDDGDVAHTGIAGQAGGSGLDVNWFQRDGVVSMVALQGTQAPGLPAGANFGFLGSTVVATANRSVMFYGWAGAPSIEGVWRYANDELQAVVTESTPAPGFPVGTRMGVSSELAINRHEDMVFSGNVSGAANFDTVWRTRAGEILLVAKQGDQAPNTPDGTTFQLLSNVGMNDQGKVVFGAMLGLGGGVTQANRTGVWYTDGDALKQLYRNGDHPPGTPTEAKFGTGNLVFGQFPPRVQINSRGQMAFQTQLQLGLGGVDNSNNGGIWATNAFGELQLVVRYGDELEVSPGEFRTVQYLGNSQLTERGEIAYLATFVGGGEGIFTSNRVAVIDGDFNFDGVVNAADYVAWRDRIGTDDPAADGNFDGLVDALDYQLWKANFGARSLETPNGPTSAVPEPGAMLAVATVAAIAGGAHRKRRG